MVQDSHRATKFGDGGERQRIKEHVRLMLRKLVSKTQKSSRHKTSE